MAQNLLNIFPDVMRDFAERYGDYPALQRVQAVVYKQCRKVLGY